jgi:hypothetical protein
MPGKIRFEKNLNLPAQTVENVEISDIVINKPELWWPNTYGDQFLYTVDVRVSINGIQSDAKQFKFGARQFAYPVDGDMLTLFCNGVRVVVKGGSWGMDDGLKMDTPEAYDNKVRLHAEANFTMIRNWVGMTNHRAFYDACDKYGILVWNDFWLANPQDGPDPNDSAMFLENAIDKIKRIRSHAALALYCGRNESNPPEPLNAGLREKTAVYDGTRFYFPNSAGPPVGSGGGYSLAVPGGEHGIKQYFNDVSSTVIRSERGIPNVPVIESLQKFVKPEHLWPISEVWALHDWTYHMNGPASTYMSTLKCYIDGDFEVPVDTVKDSNPRADNPEFQAYKKKVLRMVQDAGIAYTLKDFDRIAQMINYDNHRGLFEALTARRSNGLLMWMSQSSWPSFMWQTYDWFLDINGGYFGVKAGNQPTHAVWDPRDNTILLSNATAHAYTNISTTLTLFDLAGNVLSSKDYITDQLEPDAYGLVLATIDFSTSPSDLVFIKLIVRDASGKTLADNLYWHNRQVYQDYRALNNLPDVDLCASVSALPSTACGNSLYAITLKNSAKTPVIQTRIRTISGGKDVLPTFYSDNYFALMPDESKTISVEFNPRRLADEAPCFVLSGWNTTVKTIRSLG